MLVARGRGPERVEAFREVLSVQSSMFLSALLDLREGEMKSEQRLNSIAGSFLALLLTVKYGICPHVIEVTGPEGSGPITLRYSESDQAVQTGVVTDGFFRGASENERKELRQIANGQLDYLRAVHGLAVEAASLGNYDYL